MRHLKRFVWAGTWSPLLVIGLSGLLVLDLVRERWFGVVLAAFFIATQVVNARRPREVEAAASGRTQAGAILLAGGLAFVVIALVISILA